MCDILNCDKVLTDAGTMGVTEVVVIIFTQLQVTVLLRVCHLLMLVVKIN